MTEPKSHNDFLASWINQEGPVRFDSFMAWALYDSHFGYYNQAPGMSGGDFITAPEMGTLFSDALIYLIENFALPCKHLVEIGPGTGKLISKLSSHFKNQFDAYYLVEVSKSLKKIQKGELFEHITLNQIPPGSIIIANEWLDALPSRRIKRLQGNILEAYIGVKNGIFEWQWQETDVTLEHWPDVDGIYDVRDYKDIFKSFAQACKGSVCIWFDYGYHTNEFNHLPYLGDSLRGFYQNTVESNVLKNIGCMDLTADINFSMLANQAADAGWFVSNYFKQSHWVIDYLMHHPSRQNNTWEVRQLTDPSEMGERVRCLIFSDETLNLKRLTFDECARL